MADSDEKIYHAEVIAEAPFPGEQGVSPAAESQEAGQKISTNQTVKENSFPTKKIAHELLSSALNTRSKKILKEFQFGLSGAVQIGTFEIGQSGDLRISPDGIVARNKNGENTLVIDGETGDAFFKGSVQAGSIITGAVYVGESGQVVIDGENERILIFDNAGVARVLIGFLAGGF